MYLLYTSALPFSPLSSFSFNTFKKNKVLSSYMDSFKFGLRALFVFAVFLLLSFSSCNKKPKSNVMQGVVLNASIKNVVDGVSGKIHLNSNVFYVGETVNLQLVLQDKTFSDINAYVYPLIPDFITPVTSFPLNVPLKKASSLFPNGQQKVIPLKFRVGNILNDNMKGSIGLSFCYGMNVTFSKPLCVDYSSSFTNPDLSVCKYSSPIFDPSGSAVFITKVDENVVRINDEKDNANTKAKLLLTFHVNASNVYVFLKGNCENPSDVGLVNATVYFNNQECNQVFSILSDQPSFSCEFKIPSNPINFQQPMSVTLSYFEKKVINSGQITFRKVSSS